MVGRFLLFVLLLADLLSCQSEQQDKFLVAASANTVFMIADLVKEFEKSTAIPCDVISSSSGKLTTQILEGAPFDVFFAADTLYPAKIAESGMNLGEMYIYAQGFPVLWSKEELKIENLHEILTDKELKIAVPNPVFAPYGRAAIEILRNYSFSNESNLIIGESVAQVNQYIATGSVDIAFTASSVYYSGKIDKKKNWYFLSDTVYSSIFQGMIMLKQPDDKTHAHELKAFSEFIRSDEAKSIMEAHGYKPYDN